MERAAGEGVEIHHVHERGRAVDLSGFRRGKAQRGIKDFDVGNGEIAGTAVAHILFGIIAAGGGEFFVVGVAVPDGFKQFERACRGGVRVRGCGRAAGRQNEEHHGAKHDGNDSFHEY